MRKMKNSGFDWIGEIPSDWMTNKIKFVADFYNGDRGKNYPSGEDLVDDGIVFLTSNNIHSTVLDTKPEITKYISPERYKILGGAKIEKGDLIFCLRGSVGLCSINETEDEGTVASSLTVIRPHNINNRYINYVLNSPVAQIQTKVFENGSCAANLSAENVSTYIIPFPPLAEQKKIADFLDDKCGEIDSIKADVQRQIELLNDYKKSVITEAVTKGLNPKAKLKDSSIEWIGKIPAHWEIKPNKRIMRKIKLIKSKYEGEPILSLTMNGVIVRDLDNLVGKRPATFDGYQIIKPGNLLMCLFDIDVTPRCIGLIKNQGLTSPAYSHFSLESFAHAPYYYYYYLLLDITKELLHLSKNLRHSLTEDDLGAIKTVVPPLSEQKEIANYLDDKCTEIDSVIADKQKQLETLDEYKKSLIFEYVTGKKEVAQ